MAELQSFFIDFCGADSPATPGCAGLGGGRGGVQYCFSVFCKLYAVVLAVGTVAVR